MNEEIAELTINAELIMSDKKVGSVERTFTLLEPEDLEEDIETKTLDDMITGFLQEIEARAKEKKVEIKDRDVFYSKSTIELMLFFIRPTGDSVTMKIPVKPMTEEREDVNGNGEPPDNK